MTTTDAAELEAMIVVLRRNGVAKAKLPVMFKGSSGPPEFVELEFVPPDTKEKPDDGPATPEKQAIGEAHGYPTREEMLFASSPYPITPEELNAQPPEKP